MTNFDTQNAVTDTVLWPRTRKSKLLKAWTLSKYIQKSLFGGDFKAEPPRKSRWKNIARNILENENLYVRWLVPFISVFLSVFSKQLFLWVNWLCQVCFNRSPNQPSTIHKSRSLYYSMFIKWISFVINVFSLALCIFTGSTKSLNLFFKSFQLVNI